MGNDARTLVDGYQICRLLTTAQIDNLDDKFFSLKKEEYNGIAYDVVDGASFLSIAVLEKLQFCDNIILKNCQFENLHIENCDFSGKVIFDSVTVKKSFSIHKSNFSDSICFNHCSIEQLEIKYQSQLSQLELQATAIQWMLFIHDIKIDSIRFKSLTSEDFLFSKGGQINSFSIEDSQIKEFEIEGSKVLDKIISLHNKFDIFYSFNSEIKSLDFIENKIGLLHLRNSCIEESLKIANKSVVDILDVLSGDFKGRIIIDNSRINKEFKLDTLNLDDCIFLKDNAFVEKIFAFVHSKEIEFEISVDDTSTIAGHEAYLV
ncbi:hypothetical protein [Ferruginibacter sp.]